MLHGVDQPEAYAGHYRRIKIEGADVESGFDETHRRQDGGPEK
jgi:hypothetical protein